MKIQEVVTFSLRSFSSSTPLQILSWKRLFDVFTRYTDSQHFREEKRMVHFESKEPSEVQNEPRFIAVRFYFMKLQQFKYLLSKY